MGFSVNRNSSRISYPTSCGWFFLQSSPKIDVLRNSQKMPSTILSRAMELLRRWCVSFTKIGRNKSLSVQKEQRMKMAAQVFGSESGWLGPRPGNVSGSGGG